MRKRLGHRLFCGIFLFGMFFSAMYLALRMVMPWVLRRRDGLDRFALEPAWIAEPWLHPLVWPAVVYALCVGMHAMGSRVPGLRRMFPQKCRLRFRAGYAILFSACIRRKARCLTW